MEARDDQQLRSLAGGHDQASHSSDILSEAGHTGARDEVDRLRHHADTLEARYRALLDCALDAIIGVDEHGAITEYNQAAERIFGYTRAATLGSPAIDLIVPERFRERYRQGLARYLTMGVTEAQGRPIRLRARRVDGAEIPIELTFMRLAIAGSAGAELIASIRDLSDVRYKETQRAQADAEAVTTRITAAAHAAELAATFEAMSDGVLVYDLGAQIIHSNRAIATMMGFDLIENFALLPIEERVRLANVRDGVGRLLSIDDLPQTRVLRGESLTGEHAVDLIIATLYGTEIEVSCSVAPLHGVDGRLAGAVAVFRDITERRRLERQLGERAHDLEVVNARLQTVLHVLPVGVFIADAGGAFTQVNPMGRAIWGQNAPMLGSVSEYGSYVGWYPETGKQIAQDEWALARALTRGESTIGEEIRIQAFDGVLRTALASTAPIFDADGSITGGVTTLMDITEHERLTDRTRKALDGFLEITQALVGAPGDGELALEPQYAIATRLARLTRDVLACSRVSISIVEGEPATSRSIALVGLEPRLEQQWREEQAQRSPTRLSDSLQPQSLERLLAGESVAIDMTEPPYKDVPNPYAVSAALVVPMTMDGRLIGLLALDYVDDDKDGQAAPHHFTREEIQLAEASARLGAVVLERERLLREREATRARTLALEEANRRMDEFIGIAGHELRTPLTSVKANLQLSERRARALMDDVANDPRALETVERQRRLLSSAVRGIERQERLVRDLLDISRISSGKLRYRMAMCDLSSLLREVTQDVLLTAPERVVTLRLPAMPVMVTADADRVGQVVTNYLTNALKYAPLDQPVAVALRSDTEFARVEVADSGPGLSSEQQSHLFERFYRVDGIEARSGSAVGLGLGLYISRIIVERHGGEVGVDSAPGAGSTFWFTMPLGERHD